MKPDMQDYKSEEWIGYMFDEDAQNEDDMPDYNE